MCSQIWTNKSTANRSPEIGRAARVIHEADRLLIGVGSCMTAAGGLNDADPSLVEKWHPEWRARVIRFPFERIAHALPNSTLIRINAHEGAVSGLLANRAIGIMAELRETLARFQQEGKHNA